MQETLRFIDFAIENNCHKIWAFVMTPLPGTPLWEIARQRGKVSNDMDFDLLDLNRFDDPMLLEPDIEPDEFRSIFSQATARLDRAWLKDKWLRTLTAEREKVVRRILENPRRAFSMFKNVFFSKVS